MCVGCFVSQQVSVTIKGFKMRQNAKLFINRKLYNLDNLKVKLTGHLQMSLFDDALYMCKAQYTHAQFSFYG